MKKIWDLKNVLSNLEEEGKGRGIIMEVTGLLLLGPFYTIQIKFYVLFCTRLYISLCDQIVQCFKHHGVSHPNIWKCNFWMSLNSDFFPGSRCILDMCHLQPSQWVEISTQNYFCAAVKINWQIRKFTVFCIIDIEKINRTIIRLLS